MFMLFFQYLAASFKVCVETGHPFPEVVQGTFEEVVRHKEILFHIFLFDADSRKLRQCERVTKVPGVTFDTVCRLGATTGNRIVLRRIRGAERLDPIILNL